MARVSAHQRALARVIVDDIAEGKTRPHTQQMIAAGYAPQTAQKVGYQVIRSDGLKEAIEELGFSRKEIDDVVRGVMQNTERDDTRLRAADMLYKRLGAYEDNAAKQSQNNHLHLHAPQDLQTVKLLSEFKKKMREILQQKG